MQPINNSFNGELLLRTKLFMTPEDVFLFFGGYISLVLVNEIEYQICHLWMLFKHVLLLNTWKIKQKLWITLTCDLSLRYFF